MSASPLIRFALGLALLAMVAQAPGETLRERIRALAFEHHFTLVGLNRIGQEAAPVASGSAMQQIAELLRAYDHVVVQGRARPVDKVIVIGAKRATREPSPHRVHTVRVGTHHAVLATLTGREGKALETELIVDTGATTVVLPASTIEALGFDPRTLEPTIAHTVNGQVHARKGTLAEVRLGSARAREVEVIFVEDARALVGMSFLGRFRVTLDNRTDQLLLLAR
jgi:aspartyl protease family protein